MWSPTHTERWLLCPQKEAYVQAGEVGVREVWSPGLIVGTALHKGLALVVQRHTFTEAEEAVASSLRADWPEESGEWELPSTIGRAITALHRVAYERMPDLFADAGRVLAVEQPLGPGDPGTGQYPGTADLITEHGGPDARYLCITDWKTHWNLDDRYVDPEQVSTEESWQLYQYAYFAQHLYGRQVRHIRKCTVRVRDPKSWLYTAKVTPEQLTRWHEQATLIWAQMSHATPWQNWKSCRRYGRCEFYKQCHS